MKKRSWIDIGILIIKLISGTVFLSFIIFSIYYIASDKAVLLPAGNVSVLKDWTYYDQLEGATNILTPHVADTKGRDVFSYETVLPKDIPADSVLSFLNLSSIEVKIDNTVIYTWDNNSVPIWGRGPKNSYFFIDLPSEYAGKHVTITRFGAQNTKFHDVYVGNKYDVIRKLEKKNGLINFILSIFLLIFSLMIFIASYILSIVLKSKIHLTQISAAVFIMSCWLFFDSFVFQFVFRTRFIDGFMAYICTLCMVFPFIYYLDELQNKHYHKIYFGIQVLESANQIVFILLHILGIMPFTYSLPYIDIIIVIGIVIAFVTTLIDVFKFKNRNYKIFAIGFLTFLAFSVVEIIAINFVVDRVQGLYILIGLFILLVFAIAQQINDIYKIQHEKDLATTNMTERTRFLAAMSHEIRTPINSILGMNEVIIKETKDPKIASYANIVNDSGQLLLSLINDILDFSKIDSGKHEIVCAPYNPQKLLTSICLIMKERAENKNLSFKYDISSNVPELLYGDSKSISEVLLNILSNAIKYTPEGNISFIIDCYHNDASSYIFHFTVSDTGMGIKSDDYDKIFDPFARTDLDKNQSIQGTGLGLAITKQLIEEMGGMLSLHSKYGLGTTFMVTLPQSVPSDENTDSFEESKENAIFNDDLDNIDPDYTAPDARILVVDDNNTNLIVVKAFLKNSKIAIDVADGGRLSFKMCCQNKYDLILMDHMMPECDGIEAMHLIKESAESLNADTPIVILTANAIKGSDKLYLEEGFDNYLSKPVNSSLLIKMVRKYLPPEKIM